MTVLDASPDAPPAPAPAPRPTRRPRPDQVALGALLVATGGVWSIGLARSGWGNAFYAGAAQAGATSWSAWFYGASDAPGSVTVDKPPAALWVMGLSARVFGVSPWSVLLPQVVMGVLAVALLAAAVRRVLGPWPGVLAGLLLALTPVATLMFRYDNPDALLTLLCVLAAWAVGRALEDGRTRWLVLAGAVVGLAFLTKSLQAFLVLPGLGAAYLLAGPPRLPRRLLQLLAAGAAMVVSAGWWIEVVRLVPHGDRPWVGGTTDDDPLSLALGYNGLGRLSGDESSGGGGMHQSSSTIWRLVGSGGDEAGWLLPVAAVALVAVLVLTARAGRTDRVRAAAVLWGGWLVVTAGVLSVMKGIEHSYYAVQLAPAIAAVVTIGGTHVWRSGRRLPLAVGLVVAVVTAGTVAWWHWHVPQARAAFVGALVVLLVVALVALLRGRRRLFLVPALLALCLGPALWSVGTVAGEHQSSNVYVDPLPLSAAAWHTGRPDGAGVSSAAEELVRTGGTGFTWAAATTGHHGASLQLATGQPVMDIGGFSGQDPTISLHEFMDDVTAGRIHYYVAGTGGGPDAMHVMQWVKAHGTKLDVGATEMYDLSGLAGQSYY